MAGLLKPAAAKKLIETLKQEVSLPIHLHTHDTSGAAAATVLAAVDAGVDVVDAAMDALSGTTSQPTLGSLVAALEGGPRDPGLDLKTIREISFYWEAVRTQYRAFESDLRSGASEVYLHEMPGGQFTNLKEQARSLGLESRWHEVGRTYADVNQMFGDIVKVTPSSKVVGDMALAMVSSGLTRAEVEDPNREVAFPDSVVGFFAGELGQPPGGFPKALQKKVLKGKEPMTKRPGSYLRDVDLEAERAKALEAGAGMEIDDLRLASYLMYPKVFSDFAKTQDRYGPTEVLPTPVYFYGLAQGEEIFVELEKGKTMVLNYLGRAETNEKGQVRVFFDLNGQPRSVSVPDRLKVGEVVVRAKAAPGDPKQIGAPMPGVISSLAVKAGQKVTAGDVLCSIEAMKMETAIHADTDGVVADVTVKPGDQIDAKDLLVRFE
jgi:pyruvate carboxylase